MVKYNIFALAGMAVALPLNINLGAYSPALVVGTVPGLLHQHRYLLTQPHR